MQREPAADLPARPLTVKEGRDLLNREGVETVWVMDHAENTRDLLFGPGVSDDALVDIVLETDERYEMYSYTDYEGETMWVSFGVEQKGTEGGEMLHETLERYRLLATAGDG
jgi:hypothetical protein